MADCIRARSSSSTSNRTLKRGDLVGRSLVRTLADPQTGQGGVRTGWIGNRTEAVRICTTSSHNRRVTWNRLCHRCARSPSRRPSRATPGTARRKLGIRNCMRSPLIDQTNHTQRCSGLILLGRCRQAVRADSLGNPLGHNIENSAKVLGFTDTLLDPSAAREVAHELGKTKLCLSEKFGIALVLTGCFGSFASIECFGSARHAAARHTDQIIIIKLKFPIASRVATGIVEHRRSPDSCQHQRPWPSQLRKEADILVHRLQVSIPTLCAVGLHTCAGQRFGTFDVVR